MTENDIIQTLVRPMTLTTLKECFGMKRGEHSAAARELEAHLSAMRARRLVEFSPHSGLWRKS